MGGPRSKKEIPLKKEISLEIANKSNLLFIEILEESSILFKEFKAELKVNSQAKQWSK